MKLWLVLLVGVWMFMFATSAVHGQEVLVIRSSDNTISGVGQIDSMGNKLGFWIYFYPDGSISSYGMHLSIKLPYTNITVDPNTLTETLDTTIVQAKCGIWKSYTTDGKLDYITTYNKNGRRIEITDFGENGILSITKYSGNGKIFIREFFPSGELKEKYTTTDNYAVVGERVVFYKNGQKDYIGHYKNGQPHGVFKYFDIEGNLLRKTTYRNGVKVDSVDNVSN